LQRELYRVSDQFTEEEAIRIAKKIAQGLLTDQEGEWRHEERLKALSERTKQVVVVEKRKQAEAAMKEQTKQAQELTKQLRLKIRLQQMRLGVSTLDPESEEAAEQHLSDCQSDVEEGESEDETDTSSTEDDIVTQFIHECTKADERRILEWKSAHVAFEAWAKRKTYKIPKLKMNCRVLFDNYFGVAIANIRDKVVGGSPYGWKGRYLAETYENPDPAPS
jgi:hypothetical protein